jgi:hypothetical protein
MKIATFEEAEAHISIIQYCVEVELMPKNTLKKLKQVEKPADIQSFGSQVAQEVFAR